jgi:sodium/potassium/calcium exchanger 6
MATEPPRGYAWFALMSFACSVAWMELLANEVVALLQTIGIMWNVSTALLGITVLAIGNSIGDFIADTVSHTSSPHQYE